MVWLHTMVKEANQLQICTRKWIKKEIVPLPARPQVESQFPEGPRRDKRLDTAPTIERVVTVISKSSEPMKLGENEIQALLEFPACSPAPSPRMSSLAVESSSPVR